MRLCLIGLLVAMVALPALGQEKATPAQSLVQPAEPASPAPVFDTPPGRVGRLSLVSRNVGVRVAAEWLDAELNFPLAAGASVRTAAKARAEIEIGADTIEIAPDSEIEITRLDDRGIQIATVKGRIGFALRRLGDGERVWVGASGEGVRLLQSGHYEIDAGSGRGAVSTEGARPDFDETPVAATDYVSPYTTGVAELDAAGTWESSAAFGPCWVPAGLPADWAPYRNGHWRWIAPWGWTWFDDRPWGFAPFHYGRWAFVDQHWAWVPGGSAVDPVYVPAVVAFLGTAHVGLSVANIRGPGVGWFPLAPGETYWPTYSRDLAYVRSLNQGDVPDLETIQMDATGEPPLEVVDRHFANRRFASVVPRTEFINGGAVAQALLTLPEQRLLNAPVLMGPPVGPPVRQVAIAEPVIARPSRTEWVNHIAALVARSAGRAKALQTDFAHLRAHETTPRLHGAHLPVPAYAQPAPLQRTILLRVAHAVPPPAHGGAAKNSRH